jgi:hypothetical protein
MRRFALVLASLTCVTLACGPSPGLDAGRDADHEDGAMPRGASARVLLPRERVALGDVALGAFDVRIASLRLVSDRGEPFDPVRRDLGVVMLATTNVIELPSVAPATYSAVMITLDGAAPVLDLDVVDDVLGPVHLSFAGRQEWTARCSTPVALNAFDVLVVGVTAELEDAWTRLRSAALPPPTAGVIEVNEVTAPSATQDFVDDVGRLLRAECGVDDDG